MWPPVPPLTIKIFPLCLIDVRDEDPRKAGGDSCRVSVSRSDKEQIFLDINVFFKS